MVTKIRNSIYTTRIITLILILCSIFVLPTRTNADTIDNFDSYSNGQLHGQGGWSGDTNVSVQGSVSQSASKALTRVNTGGLDPMKKDITDITTDTSTASCYVRTDSPNNGGGGSFGCAFFNNTTQLFVLQLSQDNNNLRLWGSSFVTLMSSPSADTWYKVEIEFDFTNDRARGRVNGGSWSSYTNAQGSVAFSAITHIGAQFGGTVGNVYSDTYEVTYFEEEPVLGCTDPEAENYDPLATEDDGSCTYYEAPPTPSALNFDFANLFVTASSTCTQTSTTTWNCNGTSTEPVITYRDWLFMEGMQFFLLMFIPLGFVTSIFRKKI